MVNQNGNNINILTLISVLFLISTSFIYCQNDSKINDWEYKTISYDDFCKLLTDSLTLYNKKNEYYREHTSNEVYMMALIFNTIEIYSEELNEYKCEYLENFWTISNYMSNLLWVYDDLIGYRGFILYKGKLVFLKLRSAPR